MSWKAAIVSMAMCFWANTALGQTVYRDWVPTDIEGFRWDHPTMYMIDECRIIPHRDFTDVEITVTLEPWHDGKLEQMTTIWRDTANTVIVATFYLYTFVAEGRLDITEVEAAEVGDEPFVTLCLRYVRRLPPAVQQAFQGHYSIPYRENAQRAPP